MDMMGKVDAKTQLMMVVSGLYESAKAALVLIVVYTIVSTQA